MPLVLKDEEVKQLEGLINATPYASAVAFINFFQGIGKKRQEEATQAVEAGQAQKESQQPEKLPEPGQSNG